MKISVIIPTYKEPDYLNLCLKSCIEGQSQQNEIIVVVDGFYNENENVLKKYSEYINLLNLPQNVGLCKSTNLGVYNASCEWVLIVNDDNIFPKNWDEILLKNWEVASENNNYVISPNQIEPIPSIFKEFIIQNCGRDPNNFDLEKFWEIAKQNSKEKFDAKGGTLPIFIKKQNFIKVGGWDENYPTNGLVADWDFFHKCKLCDMGLIRDYSLCFYHFVSSATPKTPQQILNRQQQEQQGHEYAYYKWGYALKHNLL